MDMHKIQTLTERIEKIARFLADEDMETDDVISTIWLTILEKASNDPSFLLNSDYYIVQLGIWSVKSKQRYNRRIKTIPYDDTIFLGPVQDHDTKFERMVFTEVMEVIPSDLQEIVKIISCKPEKYLYSNARINITSLAATMGKSWWFIRDRLNKIQDILIKKDYEGAFE